MKNWTIGLKKIIYRFNNLILDIFAEFPLLRDIVEIISKNAVVSVLFLVLFLIIASFSVFVLGSNILIFYIGIASIFIGSIMLLIFLICLLRKSLDDYYIGRHFINKSLTAIKADGPYIYSNDGRKFYDASGGASAVSVGRNIKIVNNAIMVQLKTGLTYSGTMDNYPAKLLCKKLIKSTDNLMERAYLTTSGSEAVEAALKMARQYYYEKDKNTSRVYFIARNTSYHGNTMGALAASEFKSRRAPYEALLSNKFHYISSCYPYRQRLVGQSDINFIQQKAKELDIMFKDLGRNTVIGFIMEPVVGAALGCVPCLPGYLKAMRDVCHKHGALFILDEVMCGMGRTGTLHAWQREGIVPDLQVLAKGLGGGILPVSAVLASQEIIKTIKEGSGLFNHGQTYQSYPLGAVVGLEVLSLINTKRTLNNINIQGNYLENKLKNELGNHPYVGDIRGQGLFWAIEFVSNKITKEPFSSDLLVAHKIAGLANSMPYNMCTYPGQGCLDGTKGDHIILSPPLNIEKNEVEHIVNIMSLVINSFFNDLDKK